MANGKPRVLIIGAGIGGLTAALALERQGCDVAVFENASAIDESGSGLSVMSNAVTALRKIGLADAVADAGQELKRFVIKHHDGRLIADMPLGELSDELGAPSVCISRTALQKTLLDNLHAPVTLNATCIGFKQSADAVTVEFGNGRKESADILVGADGFNSIVREKLFGPQQARPVKYMVWLSLAPFSHPVFTQGYVGHYWGRGARFGLIDIGKGRAYWWATANVPRQEVEQAVRTGCTAPQDAKKKVLARFGKWAPEIGAVIEVTTGSVLELATLDREPLTNWVQGRVTLLGDAAHPMLTSLGQGACMAIEDGVALGECVGRHADDYQAALYAYERLRRDRANKVAALSRRISTMEQFENPIAVALRNTFFRLAPRAMLAQQNRPILTYQGAL